MNSNQHLRNRLVELDNQIALLQAERKSIQKSLGTLTYPVLQLPWEMTSEIIMHCIPNVQDSKPIFGGPQSWCFRRDDPPIALALAQTCAKWRSVAFKMPQLWSVFRIVISTNGIPSRGFQNWIERAGSSPLSFILDRPDRSGILPEMIQPILNLSTQWQNVELRLPYTDFLRSTFQSNLNGRLPCLQELQITTSYEVGGGQGAHPINVFEQAPNLQVVVLDGLPPTMILLPWTHLTHFGGNMFSAEECLHVLQLAVALVECKFTNVYHDGDQIQLSSPPHPNLEILHLKGQPICLNILGILSLPALVELEFNDGTDWDGKNRHKEIGPLLQSSPHMQHISLSQGYRRFTYGFPSKSFPHLTILEINDMIESDMPSFLSTLLEGSIPHLRRLSIAGYSVPKESIDYGELANTLEHRWNNSTGCKLESFQLTWASRGSVFGNIAYNSHLLMPYSVFRWNLSRFLDLVEEGMGISVVAEIWALAEPEFRPWQGEDIRATMATQTWI
ncbi:hypothetical protein K438DRAFT_1775776 [Mycena galopus ATCC 62051]|nr:hypothetical protein K438DRAFT_1775776 [Mycena galopus ATCC 62051]